ncbi:hypothetical protein VNO80_08589 [Phaseolus coccineus]|uniref:Uncharacterized protein n=1 Tax=Phaseolus coccineus TaxID=3886 RepID=A0AAN9NA21_PHACN
MLYFFTYKPFINYALNSIHSHLLQSLSFPEKKGKVGRVTDRSLPLKKLQIPLALTDLRKLRVTFVLSLPSTSGYALTLLLLPLKEEQRNKEENQNEKGKERESIA